MMKVTGPMNVQMKWLSTLSQHLQGGGQNESVDSPHLLLAFTFTSTTLRPKPDLESQKEAALRSLGL